MELHGGDALALSRTWFVAQVLILSCSAWACKVRRQSRWDRRHSPPGSWRAQPGWKNSHVEVFLPLSQVMLLSPWSTHLTVCGGTQVALRWQVSYSGHFHYQSRHSLPWALILLCCLLTVVVPQCLYLSGGADISTCDIGLL